MRSVDQAGAARAALVISGATRTLRMFVCALLLAYMPAAGFAGEAAKTPRAAIAAAHPAAVAAGHEVLARGGNVFDAAVAVAAALGVVEPFGSGLGGGGFFLLHRASDGLEIMVDARERAPLSATANMYLDTDGQPVPRASLDGPLAAGIPGLPAALVHIGNRYGRLSVAENLAPAIRLAREGFAVTSRYRRYAEYRRNALAAAPGAAALLDDGFVPDDGFIVRQHDLARTLEALARHGRDGFYAGDIARALIDGVRAAGGIWQLDDLEQYRVVERAPLTGRYRDMRVASAALPSSGGVVLLEVLGLLEPDASTASMAVERTHRTIEAMRLAYYNRARYLGDPDVVTVDVPRLLAPAYLSALRRLIGPRARPSVRLPKALAAIEREQTTHFSIIDREGNRVAATLSINGPFGSAFVPPGTGVLLNNEMDDFVIKPGVANLYGLVGNEANAIAPGKRPLSSMTPTFLETPRAIVVLGTPGGSRIISMVLLSALDIAHGHGDATHWVARQRFHHQYLPDRVEHEPGAFTPALAAALRERGHALKGVESYGNMQLVVWDKRERRLAGASDPRGEGAVVVK